MNFFHATTKMKVFAHCFSLLVYILAIVVQKVDNAIQWIEHNIGIPNTYPLDSDLSTG